MKMHTLTLTAPEKLHSFTMAHLTTPMSFAVNSSHVVMFSQARLILKLLPNLLVSSTRMIKAL